MKIAAWSLIAVAVCIVALVAASLIRADRDFRAMVGGSQSVGIKSLDFDGQHRTAGFHDTETAEYLSRRFRLAAKTSTNQSGGLSFNIRLVLSTGWAINGDALVFEDLRQIRIGVPEIPIGENDYWFVDIDTNAPPKLIDLMRFLSR